MRHSGIHRMGKQGTETVGSTTSVMERGNRQCIPEKEDRGRPRIKKSDFITDGRKT